ncbi:M20/M25/M40 family metallo-hydrolase [Candidatus Dojkabacteria bacterium]|uniref:M20/M25/M40 family metallo-hydrolase n=1 Tax=Candidatus Dojkabacteria bacterium TaxID=2099670 RepID=A0A955IAZ1_9BACT|nr:M20/M25/M40 family metallo-hydrolase [Candidatus Dojkabacteria bacterium]
MDTYSLYRQLLDKFISFKSISTDPEYKDEMMATAKYLEKIFKEYDFDVKIIEGYGNPFAYAEYNKLKDAETCLIYGHYDVQPASLEDGWDSEPFVVDERDGKLYARGIVDNKGQVLVHIATIFNLIKEGKLKYNIKFLIEGDEESGSVEIDNFIADHKNLLKSDFFIISDGPILQDYPTIDVSFRGVINCELKIKTSGKDLHSGMYGGIVPNAAEEAARIINILKDEEHWLNIEGLNEEIDMIDVTIIENNKSIPISADELLVTTGTKVIFYDEEIDPFTRNGLFTSMEVTGFNSGYTGNGFRNAVPGKASVKLNFRLRPDITPNEFKKLFSKHIESIIADYADFEIIYDQDSPGVFLNTDNTYLESSISILEEVFGKQVLKLYQGAIVPIGVLIQNELQIPGGLINLANEDSDMHAANENFDIGVLKKGIKFSEKFFGK